jgi:hypothetical protein
MTFAVTAQAWAALLCIDLVLQLPGLSARQIIGAGSRLTMRCLLAGCSVRVT